jgi:hypothetical protein
MATPILKILFGKMASPGQLCEAIARSTGKSLPTVTAYDYQLAQAGLRTAGGRGRSAAKVTVKDAATLLIVSMVGPAIKDTLATYAGFSGLRASFSSLGTIKNHAQIANESLGKRWELKFAPVPKLTALKDDHTFPDCLAAMIEAIVLGQIGLARDEAQNIDSMRGSRISFIKVRLSVPLTSALASITTSDFVESRMYHSKWPKAAYLGPPSDLSADFTITEQTLYAVGKCLRDEPPRKRPKQRKARATIPLLHKGSDQ